MSGDDIKKLLTGKTLFRLDTLLSVRLVPVLYALGLCAILIWAINHLFLTFGSNFGNGLWGLLEIVVYGLLSFIVLRVVCEALLIFFKANEGAVDTVARSRVSASLLDEVREAIRDLADKEEADEYIEVEEIITPATDVPPSDLGPATEPGKATGTATVRRTVKRATKPKTTGI